MIPVAKKIMQLCKSKEGLRIEALKPGLAKITVDSFLSSEYILLAPAWKVRVLGL